MFLPKKMIGIDIGTSSVKIVELSRFGKGIKLENYGEIQTSLVYKESSKNYEKSSGLFSKDNAAKAVRAILQEARIKTKDAVFSISDFSTFCTSFEMPQMPEKEIAGAIKYNASQYITLPISEVSLDWKIVSDPKSKSSLVKVFLAAIPNQIIQDYKDLASMSGLNLYALEAESFSVTRALTKNSGLAPQTSKTVCVMDIGVQSSTVNIVDNGYLKRSYSFNFYSSKLTNAISAALSVDYKTAEKIKNEEGLFSRKAGVAKTLYILINPLIAEIRSISYEFMQSEQKEVQEIYITGGPAIVPDCFANFLYPPVLEETLKEMNPRFSVAVGACLAGLEE